MSKTYTEKIEERIKWHYLTSEEAPNYIENRAIATRLCSEDPLFFINNFCYTYDPRGKKQPEKHLPFILYRLQEDAIIYIITTINKTYGIILKYVIYLSTPSITCCFNASSGIVRLTVLSIVGCNWPTNT